MYSNIYLILTSSEDYTTILQQKNQHHQHYVVKERNRQALSLQYNVVSLSMQGDEDIPCLDLFNLIIALRIVKGTPSSP